MKYFIYIKNRNVYYIFTILYYFNNIFMLSFISYMQLHLYIFVYEIYRV